MQQISKAAIAEKLRRAGLRPTRQRVSLATLLFAGGDRHLTAEELHAEAVTAHVPVSLATIYNTLNQFTDAGLLREVATDGHKAHFDTNTSNHHHFYLESENRLVDIPDGALSIQSLPEPPPGKRIGRVDVIVRLLDK